MGAFIEPNIHPVFVHFAYALMTTAAVSLLITSLAPASPKRESLKIAADWMIAFGAVAIVATVAAGFQAFNSVAHDEPAHVVMTTHRNWAVSTAIVLLALSGWRWMHREERPSTLFALLFLAAAVSLSVTAWWGGRLVYGHGLGVESLPSAEGEEHHHHHHETGDRHDGGAAHDHGDAQDAGAAHEHGDAQDADDHHHDAGDDHDRHTDDALSKTVEGSPEATVDAFAAALSAGDAAAAEALLLPGVIIAEGGGAEHSRAEYADRHLPADIAVMASAQSTVTDREVLAGGNMASVISQQTIRGARNGKPVDLSVMETMVLERVNDDWRIAHIHWSSAPIAEDRAHQE